LLDDSDGGKTLGGSFYISSRQNYRHPRTLRLYDRVQYL
jgi:hypothetical protein